MFEGEEVSFIKSDIERLDNQLRVLLESSQQGWQTIYFSAKKEVKDNIERYYSSDEFKGLISIIDLN